MNGDQKFLRVLASDDFGDDMQRIRQTTACDRILVVGEARVPSVRVFPEAIRLRNRFQHCRKVKRAAAAVEIARQIVIGVLQLQIPRFQIIADLLVIPIDETHVEVLRDNRDQMPQRLQHGLLHVLVSLIHSTHPTQTHRETTRRPSS